MTTRRITYDAPVLPFDWPYDDGDQIHACNDCLPWHAELTRDPETDALWVREWHAVDCRLWKDIEE